MVWSSWEKEEWRVCEKNIFKWNWWKEKTVVRWKDKVKEYMHERLTDRGGGIKLAKRKCMDRER